MQHSNSKASTLTELDSEYWKEGMAMECVLFMLTTKRMDSAAKGSDSLRRALDITS